MLYTKFRGYRPAGSGEEDFLRVFTIYGRGGHLCYCRFGKFRVIFISRFFSLSIFSLIS